MNTCAATVAHLLHATCAQRSLHLHPQWTREQTPHDANLVSFQSTSNDLERAATYWRSQPKCDGASVRQLQQADAGPEHLAGPDPNAKGEDARLLTEGAQATVSLELQSA